MSPASPQMSSPKVWLITSATSPLGFSIARQALKNGDRVVAGCSAEEYAALQDSNSLPLDENVTPQNNNTAAVKGKSKSNSDEIQFLDLAILSRLGGSSFLTVSLDTRALTSCQAALAYTLGHFGRIDILLSCTSHTYYGALEECSDWQAREQFEVSYFGTVNIVKTVVKEMREKATGGHIICVTSLAAQTGTPGLSLLTAAHHAVEGFTEALAFEVAPFNIKLTNVEPSLMTYLLTNPVHLPPPTSPQLEEPIKPAKPAKKEPQKKDDDDDEDDEDFSRSKMGVNELRTMLETVVSPSGPSEKSPAAAKSESGSSDPVTPLPRVLQYPKLSVAAQLDLAAETTRVIMAVAGKDNPPGRIIVGGEDGAEDGEGGVQSVKERMKAVSEELEEFLECSMSVDISNAVEDDHPEDGNAMQV